MASLCLCRKSEWPLTLPGYYGLGDVGGNHRIKPWEKECVRALTIFFFTTFTLPVRAEP